MRVAVLTPAVYFLLPDKGSTAMSLSRRELLTASALLLAGPGAALRAAGKEAAAGETPMVLCWNENPYGPSPAARLAVSRSIARGCRYPADAEIQALVEALARHEDVGADCIVTGTGSGELLCALGLLCGRDGGEIIAAAPTYAELPDYARLRGATLKFVPVDAALRHDLPAMHAAVSERTRAIYICNPNNPTGTALGASEVRAFVAALPERLITIVDEAYMDFTVGADVASVADLVATSHRVVVLRTFSKIHGMAGLRCGYAIARPDLAAALAATRMSTPNILAVHAARASLGDRVFLAECRRRIIASRTRITTELARLGLRYAEPQGNFVFFDTGMPLARFTGLMRARNILVGRLFAPYENWCRITIGTEPEVSAFLEALRAITAS
ncbi:MAG: aminotransferase class I/II-fold pyridoxal phosphate-dependent enzyme [Gammaproteobacteria bacterium]|nr:MAG: aminotransferase class I/II-fold pyridoxal phosphate-dependent enzyme [Gammaproteobacteria bacterium]TLZ41832.1 MAG: aminotransferase class I/II-fold pyridoxal phosphate-dependent enzyme [Gammaproteobacteria bacterium]